VERKEKEKILEPLKPDMMVKAKHWKVPYMETDDLFQECYLKCWTALDKFKGGSSPETYCYRVMENCLKDLFRKQKKLSMENNYEDDDMINETEDRMDAKIMKEYFVNEIKKLPAIEKAVIRMKLGLVDGVLYTNKEIGMILDLTSSRVGQIEKKALSKIKSLKDIKK